MEQLVYLIIGLVIGYLIGRRNPKLITVSPNQEKIEEKQKHLSRIMEYFTSHEQASNDKIQAILGVSDASTERYLDELEQQGKIEQVGRTGRNVIYKRK